MPDPAPALCGTCHAISVAEGTIPVVCLHCDPPRLGKLPPNPTCERCEPYPGDPCICGGYGA